jgi:hypothetical protein
MSAKDYLIQLKIIDTKINQKQKELAVLKEKALSQGAINYDRDRVQTSPRNAQEQKICRYLDLADEIQQQIETYLLDQHRIIDEIQKLDDKNYIDLLYKHYVEFKDFTVVSEEMHFSYDYIKHLHKDALRAFEKLKDNTK